jgi:hypothetical protein
MQNSTLSIRPIVATRIFAVATLIAVLGVPALATDDCATKPDLRATGGGHWYYYSDPVKNRKCWFLEQAAIPAPAPQQRASTVAASDSPSLLSRLTAALRSASQQQAKAEEPPPNALSRQQPQIDGRNLVSVRALARRERPISKLSQDAVADQGDAADKANRDVLFRQFLMWQERQSTNTSP